MGNTLVCVTNALFYHYKIAENNYVNFIGLSPWNHRTSCVSWCLTENETFVISDTDYIPSSNITTPATPGNMMAQSMPPSLLEAATTTTTGNGKQPHSTGNGEAVDALSRTCTTLQRQVEMLQSSLSGVMHFMSAFTSFDSQQQLLQQQQQQRTRHSSAASTNQDSFCYYSSGKSSVFFLPSLSKTNKIGFGNNHVAFWLSVGRAANER